MRSFSFQEFVRRRTLRVAGVYLAAAWGVLEFTDWVSNRFGLPSVLLNVVIGGLVVLFPVVLVFTWRLQSVGGGVPGIPASKPARRSIAVLPFDNPGDDPADEFLSDGIADEITVALAKLEGLHVASRTSAFAYKGHKEDVRRIGEALNVESLLEGSVQRAGDRIRVATRLVSAFDGYHLWSAHYDREIEDVFAIEDEIAENVAAALRVILREDERPALRLIAPEDIRAYEYYLRGRQFFHQMRRKSLEYARQMFQKAVEIDPHYARAHAGIAEASSFLNMFYPGSDDDLEQADAGSRRALELAPQLPEAHSARGFTLFLLKQLDAAEREFRIALELEPQLFDAHYFYARASFQQGHFEKAARLFQSAADLREDYQAAFFAAQSLEALGREGEARQAYETALEVAARHMDFNPDDPRAATMRAVALCRLGRADEGLRWAEQALAIDPEDAGVRYNVACLYALEGSKDRAFECLSDAVRSGFGNRDWLERDPDIASLRDDPRFEELWQTDDQGPRAPSADLFA